MSDLDFDEVSNHLESARNMISDLCQRRREWIMSIPARPDYDPDLVIGQALRDAQKMLAILRAAELPLERNDGGGAE